MLSKPRRHLIVFHVPAATVSPATNSSSPLVRAGGWLFRRRTSLPIPLALALLLLPSPTGAATWRWFAAGAVIVAAGELLRIWAVRHIGVVSRTHSERLGPLVASGPFGYVRNPLYLGNIALWVGLAVSARLAWLVPVLIVVLALEYHAIVRWEETLLETRRGDDYRDYARRVPRWLPAMQSRRPGRASALGPPAHSWKDTFFSERGTLIAIAVGYLLLWGKLLVLIRLHA